MTKVNYLINVTQGEYYSAELIKALGNEEVLHVGCKTGSPVREVEGTKISVFE